MNLTKAKRYLCRRYPLDKREIYLWKSSKVWAVFFNVKRKEE